MCANSRSLRSLKSLHGHHPPSGSQASQNVLGLLILKAIIAVLRGTGLMERQPKINILLFLCLHVYLVKELGMGKDQVPQEVEGSLSISVDRCSSLVLGLKILVESGWIMSCSLALTSFLYGFTFEGWQPQRGPRPAPTSPRPSVSWWTSTHTLPWPLDYSQESAGIESFT